MNVYKFLEEFRSKYHSQLNLIIDRYDLYKDKSCIIQDTFLDKYSCGFTANFDPYEHNSRINLTSLKELSIDMKFDTLFNKEVELLFINISTSMFSILFSKNKTTIKFYSNFRYVARTKDIDYMEFKEFLSNFSWNDMPVKTLDTEEDISMAILTDEQRINLSLFDKILSELEN